MLIRWWHYSYRDLQKATYNFTTLIGQGAFGPVYKAQMSTGEIVAVKVLATDSKQGEKEFQTEVTGNFKWQNLSGLYYNLHKHLFSSILFLVSTINFLFRMFFLLLLLHMLSQFPKGLIPLGRHARKSFSLNFYFHFFYKQKLKVEVEK